MHVRYASDHYPSMFKVKLVNQGNKPHRFGQPLISKDECMQVTISPNCNAPIVMHLIFVGYTSSLWSLLLYVNHQLAILWGGGKCPMTLYCALCFVLQGLGMVCRVKTTEMRNTLSMFPSCSSVSLSLCGEFPICHWHRIHVFIPKIMAVTECNLPLVCSAGTQYISISYSRGFHVINLASG